MVAVGDKVEILVFWSNGSDPGETESGWAPGTVRVVYGVDPDEIEIDVEMDETEYADYMTGRRTINTVELANAREVSR